MESTELTQSYLKELLHYDKDTGIFTWIISPASRVKKGDIAGTIGSHGYIRIGIRIDGITRYYRAHRLVWLYEYGKFPKHHIDHINHVQSDNRLFNLREADQRTNNHNRSINSNNKSGTNGVIWNIRSNVWCSRITVNRKAIHLGFFKDKNEAICARLHANRLYKFHANHGK